MWFPINKSLKPKLKEFLNFFKSLKKFVKKEQIVIIRSSIYPGTFSKIATILKKKNSNIFYCPERIVQGKSIKDGGLGYSCIAEIRMVETILEGKPKTPFMKFGDTTRIEMKDKQNNSIFGKIEQQVKKV